jgi:two-component system sensor histidine kinase QseC
MIRISKLAAGLRQAFHGAMGSLRWRLIAFSTALIAILGAAAIAAAALVLHDQAGKFFDTVQLSFARQLAASDPQKLALGTAHLPDPKKSRRHGRYDSDALSFAVFSSDGRMLFSDGHKGRHIHFDGKARGFVKAEVDDDDFRVVWMDSTDKRMRIAVGQEMEFRDDLVLGLVESQLWIFAVLMLLLGLGTAFIVSRSLKPFAALKHDLATRRPYDGTPIDGSKLPSEIRPATDALSAYFAKSAAMMRHERSFVSDAAHELRTPLTGLMLQAKIANSPDSTPADREAALGSLESGIRRCSRLVRQLLILSRLDDFSSKSRPESEIPGMERGWVDFASLLEDAISHESAIWNSRGKSVNLEERIPETGGLALEGWPEMASLIAQNLIGNAFRYTPEGGRIRVTLGEDSLVVENDSAAYAPKDRARLGERFFRPAGQTEGGSGLGLSITRAISQLHGLGFEFSVEDGAEPGRAVFRAKVFKKGGKAK